jgi:hypothetical protein
MSVSLKKKFNGAGERGYAQFEKTPARHQSARASPDVAEVVNRPKKRPGNRRRSSITIGAANRQAMLV